MKGIKKNSICVFSPFWWLRYYIFLLLIPSSLTGQEVKQIEINADYIEFDSDLGTGAKRLLGNVRFMHEDILMTCDSAWYFSEENMVESFSNVHLWQGDTLDLYGDYLRYSGNNKMANVRNNVVLIDNENRLTTDYIDHDFGNDLAYYLDGGRIINGDNTLVSKQGYYYTREKLFFFKDSVVVINPDYTMYSDTLKYNTITEVAYFLGPTDIISDENYIYCENGWYDTQNNISQFNKNAYLQNEGQILKGDSIYYNRKTGLGKAFKNVLLEDTTENMILQGEIAIYNEQTEYAMLTDSALMIQVEKGDTLFIHADTLLSIPDTIPEKRLLKAFYHVKFFREDIQGKCDSLVYTDVDSVFHFFGDPVLWSDENQLSAEKIEIYTKNQQLDRLEMINAAFIISFEDSTKFNQIKGRNMTGYIIANQLRRITVDGNSQSIYYAKEEEDYIGVNKAESSNLEISFSDNKINKILFKPNTDGTFFPIQKFPSTEAKFEGFRWYEEYRPRNRNDVFRWN
ncbi:MAG: OstA-like protein [Bacteroidota bacterium]